MKKRILSIILALAVVSSLIPVTTIPAFAAGDAISRNGNDIFADGSAIILQAGNIENYTNIFIDIGADGNLDDGEAPINLNEASLFNGTLTGDTTSGFDLSGNNVYGGSKNLPITGNTNITMLSGKVAFIGGAGQGIGASLIGDTQITVHGGLVDSIYGGGSGNGSNITGNTNVDLLGGTLRFVRGGGGDSFVSGSTNILIDGATFDSSGYTWVFGGGDGPNGTVGTANVNIKAGSSFDIAQIYGGGGDNGTVLNGTNVVIDGGTFSNSNIYGGGQSADIGTNTTSADCNLTINGGTFGYGIYGGGYGGVVYGDTNVVINNASGNGSVYGGGYGTSLIMQNTTVTVNGGSISEVCGGTDWNGTGSVDGNASIYVNSGSIANLYLGANKYSSGSVGGAAIASIFGGIVNNIYKGQVIGTPSVIITGGNIAATVDGTITSITNGSTPVYKTEMTIGSVNYGTVTSLEVTSGGSPYIYGLSGVKTSVSKLCAYLPDGAITTQATVDGVTYVTPGITTNTSGTAIGTLSLPPSTTPTAAVTTVAKTSPTQAKVDFTLDSPLTGTWKVYDAQTGGSRIFTVTASISGTTLSLTHASNIPAGTYYISVTEAGKSESTRLALTVGTYVAPTYAVSAATNAVQANGVTATATFGFSPYSAGATATVTIALSGAAAATGTHTIGLTSSADAGTITAPATVTKIVTAGATPTDIFAFTFTMPANAVDDLVVTHTFLQDQSTAPTASATTVAKTAATQAKVDFTLDSALTGTWKVYDAQTNGSLVSGVTASASGTTLSLTHTSNIPAGTYYVSVTEAGKNESTRLALTVGSYIYIEPSITTTPLPSATTGTPYSQILTATGDTPINWAITSGALPDGLSLAAGGLISGIPTTAGTYSFGVTASNGPNGNEYNDTEALSITVIAPTYAVSAATNAVHVNGITATATFGATPYTAGATATVTVTLSGTAAATGTHTVGLTSSADAGTITAPAIVTKAVTAGDTPTDTFAYTFTMTAYAVDDLVVTHTFLQDQSSAPTAGVTTVAKTAATQATVDFTLDSALTGTWKVYDAQTGGSLVNGVTVSVSGTTLSLNHASNILAGTYYVSVTEAGKAESARLALTVGAYVAPTYTMAASALTVFAGQTVGYSTAPAAQTVTISNTGNQTITLTQPAITNSASNYNIGTLSSATLSAGGTVTFTVQPKTGLAVGTYAENINIVGSNSAATSVSAIFSVTAANTTPVVPPVSAGSSAPTPVKDDKVDIIFNKDSEKVATAKVEEKDNIKTTVVTLDDAAVKVNLDKMDKADPNGKDKKVIIPVNNNSNVVVGELSGQTVKNMEEMQAVLEIKTENATYTLPADDINIDAVSDQMGKQIELKDIKVNVRIAEASTTTTAIVADSARKNSYIVVVKPVDFEITCTSGTKTVNVAKFNSYVERTVAIPAGIDPGKITTGVVLNTDGTFSHVPTTIVVIDGKYYAKINSLTNSTYTVISNPIDFKDAEKHWAKNYVNEIGSRLIDSGVGNGNFEPNRAITRAEFASMIVKALGLKGSDFSNKFSDVKKSDPYYQEIYTAYEYGIIAGYSNGNFGAQDLITRQQAMIMIWNAMKISGMNGSISETEISSQLEQFKDSEDITSSSKQAATSCIKYGIFGGNKGKLNPNGNLTRAESATIIIKLLKKSNLI